MSETTAEYKTTKDDFDLENYIEQECIQGSIKESQDRLRSVIQKAAEHAETNPALNNVEGYVKLETLSLELARFALDYLAIQKGIDPSSFDVSMEETE